MISVTSKLKKIFLGAVLVAFSLVLTVLVLLVFTPPKFVIEADAGFKKAKQTIDPEELRAWALESIEYWSKTNRGSPVIPQSKIPKYIRDLYPYPPEAVVGQNSVVMIIWGGGGFHWAIDIGLTNFVSEPNGVRPKVFMWAPGIYYSREAHWDLQ